MKSTFDLLEAYLFTIKIGYTDLRLNDYNLNGSIIKITYSYTESYSTNSDIESYESSDNILVVDLLDYISFVFNSFLPEISK